MAVSKQVNTLSYAEVVELEAPAIKQSEEDFKEKFKNAIRDIILPISDGLSEDEINGNAEYYLTGEGEEVDSRQPDQPESEQILRAVKAIHDLYHETNKMYTTAYLFLNAPYECAKRNEHEDRIANMVQNENMYYQLHGIDHEQREKNPMEEVVVRTKANIEDALKRVFAKYLLHTKGITIVFNGEGYKGDGRTPKGSLCFAEDQPLAMRDFLSLVVQIWGKVVKEKAVKLSTADPEPAATLPSSSVMMGPDVERPEEPMETEDLNDYMTIMDKIPPLPSNVSIIFGQCYSFAGAEDPIKSDWGSTLENVILTAPDVRHGTAACTYRLVWKGEFAPFKIPGLVRYLQRSNHLELNHYAEQVRVGCPHDQVQVRRK